jgi:hypothetical protein
MKRVVLAVLLGGLVLIPPSPATAQVFAGSPAGWSAALDFVDDAYVKRDREAVASWLWEGMDGNDRDEIEVILEEIADTSSAKIEVRAILLRAPGGELGSLAAELVTSSGLGSEWVEYVQRKIVDPLAEGARDTDVMVFVVMDMRGEPRGGVVPRVVAPLGHLLRDTPDGWKVVHVADG